MTPYRKIIMKNAHDRFGVLEYTKRMKDTTRESAFGKTGLLEKLTTRATARPTSSLSWVATPTLGPSGQR